MDERLINAGFREGQADDPDEEFVGALTVPWFGNNVETEVVFRLAEAGREPSEKQIEALCRLLPPDSSFFADLPETLLAHYNTARDESSLSQESIAELFPPIQNAAELDRMIELRGILVWHYDADWSSYIGVLAECNWEEEHGLGIKVVDGVPIEIGNQDIVI